MLALIDSDIIKYSVGFATQKTVYTDEDGCKLLIEQCPGGMKATNLDTKAVTVHEGLRTKQAVLEAIGGEWEQEVVPEPEENAAFTVKQMLKSTLKLTGAEQYLCYLSKGDCFRVGIYPEYKANRKDTPKPYHAQTVEDYLLKYHPTCVYSEIEADDAMGIYQYQSLRYNAQPTVICSLDKDLQMIPGWHWNWNTRAMHWMSQEEANFAFWCQTLTGDATDNIPGLQGIGPRKAEKLLADAEPKEYKGIVIAEYEKQELTEEDFERNAKLLWILRKGLEETYGMSYSEFFQ